MEFASLLRCLVLLAHFESSALVVSSRLKVNPGSVASPAALEVLAVHVGVPHLQRAMDGGALMLVQMSNEALV